MHRPTFHLNASLRRALVGLALAIAPLLGIVTTPSAAGAEPTATPFWSEAATVPQVNGTYTVASGSFAADPVDAVVFVSPTGADHLWRWNAAKATYTSVPLSPQRNGNGIPIVGRFAGNDELDDILWYGPGPAADELWRASGNGTFTKLPVSINGTYQPKVLRTPTTESILWWAPGASTHPLWTFSGWAGDHATRTVSGPAGAQPVIGDFDANRHHDVFWYGPGATADLLTFNPMASGPTQSVPQQVNGTYRPVVLNLKDGETGPIREDILWYSSTSSTMSVWHNVVNGRWTTRAVHLPARASITPVAVRLTGMTAVHLRDTAGRDWVAVGDADFGGFPVVNSEPGAGAIPLVLNVHGSWGHMPYAIFWYEPGAGRELLFATPV